MIKKYIAKQKFNPDLLGLMINPYFFARRGLRSGIGKYAALLKGNLLDVGCGKKPYKHLFNVDKYVGMDIENPGHDHTSEDIDVYYDGVTFPFDNETFDSVISSEVLEHVFNPDQFLSEIRRVLKAKDGLLLITVPFVWDEHEQPNDYARYSSFGIKHLLNKNGFTIVDHTKSIDDFRVVVQLLNLYTFKRFSTKNRIFNAIGTLIFIFPVSLVGLLLAKFLPRNQELYLTNIVLAKKQ